MIVHNSIRKGPKRVLKQRYQFTSILIAERAFKLLSVFFVAPMRSTPRCSAESGSKISVWVFNHYASTPDMPGLTRHQVRLA